ncbi:MAG: hypothetical protein ACQEXX_01485 [Bacillota bacterium]
MNLFKTLLFKSKHIRKLIHRSSDEIHKEKLKEVSLKLKEVKNELIKLLPTQFWNRFEDSCYISGGCIYSLYHDNQPKDYDFFISSKELAAELRDYFIDQAEYKGNSLSGGLFRNLPLCITDNAISIGKYQIITQWIGEPEDVIMEFDFKHNQNYWRKNRIYTLSDWSYLKGKALVYNEARARDICGTLMRVPRFIQRGMTIRQKELAKMMLKLHEVGFSERELTILRDSKADKHFGS